MPVAEYVGRVLPDGHLDLPARVRRDLRLTTNQDVKVIVTHERTTESDCAQEEADRKAIWQRLEALRQRLSGMEFSLTDALLEAREEEDAAL